MIPEKMYEAHRAQNYVMVEKARYKKRLYMEQANRQRELISKNWYKVQKGDTDVRNRNDREG